MYELNTPQRVECHRSTAVLGQQSESGLMWQIFIQRMIPVLLRWRKMLFERPKIVHAPLLLCPTHLLHANRSRNEPGKYNAKAIHSTRGTGAKPNTFRHGSGGLEVVWDPNRGAKRENPG